MTTLGDIVNVSHNLTNINLKAIKILHMIVFRKESSPRLFRRNLKKFSGFHFKEGSAEYDEKVKELSSLCLPDLILVCHILDIDYKGSEDELAQRICLYLNNPNDVSQEDDKDDDEDDEDKQDDDDKEDDDDKDDDEDEEDDEDKDDEDEINEFDQEEDETRNNKEKSKNRKVKCIQTRKPRVEAFALTFRDVETSIRRFNGKDGYPVEKWIQDFEELAEIMNWNELQKLIFAKKSLDDVAKLFITFEKGITSWVSLKKRLKKEFDMKIDSAQVHRQLMTRKKKKEESIQEYMLIMRDIASRANVEKEVVIQYIIDGIPDDTNNKIVLYGARTYDELKEKIKIYKLVKSKAITEECKQTRRDNFTSKERIQFEVNKGKSSQNNNPDETVNRCFNCGDKGHHTKTCPSRAKGFKCFSCNQFGHKSSECMNETKRDTKTMMNIKYRKNSAIKTVTIGKIVLSALVDTGSDVNLIRLNEFILLGVLHLEENIIQLSGIGEHEVNTLGNFMIAVTIDNVTVRTTIHVVPNNVIKTPMVIGYDFLKRAKVTIDQDGIRVTPQEFIIKVEEEGMKRLLPKNDEEQKNIVSQLSTHVTQLKQILADRNEEVKKLEQDLEKERKQNEKMRDYEFKIHELEANLNAFKIKLESSRIEDSKLNVRNLELETARNKKELTEKDLQLTKNKIMMKELNKEVNHLQNFRSEKNKFINQMTVDSNSLHVALEDALEESGNVDLQERLRKRSEYICEQEMRKKLKIRKRKEEHRIEKIAYIFDNEYVIDPRQDKKDDGFIESTETKQLQDEVGTRYVKKKHKKRTIENEQYGMKDSRLTPNSRTNPLTGMAEMWDQK